MNTNTTHSSAKELTREDVQKALELIDEANFPRFKLELRYGCTREKLEEYLHDLPRQSLPNMNTLTYLYGVPIMQDRNLPKDELRMVDSVSGYTLHYFKLENIGQVRVSAV